MHCGVRGGLASLVAAAFVLFATGVSAAQDRGSLGGRVADDFGDPLGGVVVEAVSVSGYRVEVRTSAGGWYELAGLVAGAYSVSFSLEGYLPHAQRVTVRAGASSTLPVSLVPVVPASLSGVVVDQQGLALPGARVEAVSPGAAPVVRITDEAGRFAIRPARPGAWSLAASLAGFVTERIGADVSFGEAAEVSLSLALDYALAEEVVVGRLEAAGRAAQCLGLAGACGRARRRGAGVAAACGHGAAAAHARAVVQREHAADLGCGDGGAAGQLPQSRLRPPARARQREAAAPQRGHSLAGQRHLGRLAGSGRVGGTVDRGAPGGAAA